VFTTAHIELTKDKALVESYCKKLATRQKTKDKPTRLADEMPRYTTTQFWEDLAQVWDQFKNKSKDHMECFDLAVLCLIDKGKLCQMTAVNPQVRKAFMLYGHSIMRQLAPTQNETDSIADEVCEEASGSEEEIEQEADEDSDGSFNDEDSESGSDSASEGTGAD